MKKEYKTPEKIRLRSEAARRAKGVPPKKSFNERFWGRSEYVTETGCRIWLGSVTHSGHGECVYKGRLKRTHRIAWMELKGPIPEGLNVLHKCDVPSCINVDHLFLGTQRDNMMDMKRKGRGAKGERRGASKLTKDDVVSIRADRRSYSAISKDHGVCIATLSSIKNRKTWRHV